MNRTAVDSPLENEHGSALWILGIFLDDDRRANASEEFIHRESVVSERVVDVLGYPNVPGGDQGGELLPEAGHHALSGILVLPHNACDQRLATNRSATPLSHNAWLHREFAASLGSGRSRTPMTSLDTFGRVFSRLDTSEFYACLQRWIRSLNKAISDHGVRLDGKTLRHSFDTAAGKDALPLLDAWSSDLQVCLGRMAVDEKSNEITAVPKLLDLLELAGAVVTLDAMHCQKTTAQAICDNGVDYVLTVKGNKPALHEQIQKCFEDAGDKDYNVPGLRRLKKTDRGHGRIERREYCGLSATNAFDSQAGHFGEKVFDSWPATPSRVV